MKLTDAIKIRLKNIITERKLTQYKLSSISGVPESTLSTILSGKVKTVKLSTIYDICSSLNMELGEFFEDKIFKIENLED